MPGRFRRRGASGKRDSRDRAATHRAADDGATQYWGCGYARIAMERGTFQSVDPSTGDVLAVHAASTDDELDAALDAASAAQRAWARWTPQRRAEPFRCLAGLFRSRRESCAQRIVAEMGKSLLEAYAEIDKCAWSCEHFADQADYYLRSTVVPTEAHRSWIEPAPLGVVLAVMPWNFPYWQVLRGALPAVLAGNGLLLKHAPNVFGCADDLTDMFREAGFPEGLFHAIKIDTARVSGLIFDRRICAATLTGSVAAGRAIGALAGAALKKCVLELGGSDPLIVLDDADLEHTVAAAIHGRFQNCGQTCIAAKRIIVHRLIWDEFTTRFGDAAARLRVGNPRLEDTQLGPMARTDLRDGLAGQLQSMLASGGTIIAQGTAPDGPGSFFAPTVVVADRDPLPPDQEVFGPVALLLPADDDEQAIAIANRTDYGLSGSVWTHDLSRAEHVARSVASGSFFVNRVPASDPRMPFGGIRDSGYGRELGDAGVREFANIRSIWIDRHERGSHA